MNPKHLLNDYLNGRISGDELQCWLVNDGSREARKTLEILSLDKSARKALKEFARGSGAAGRLAEKVSDAQSWTESYALASPSVSKRWLPKLVPADVTGHGNSTQKTKKRAPGKRHRKQATRRNVRVSKKNSARNGKSRKE